VTRLALLFALAGSLVFIVSPAGAAAPVHDRFSVPIIEIDSETCSFPVARDLVFTNDITEFSDSAGIPTKLQLHQSTVGTLTANGKTLRMNIRETIMVEFDNGIPVTAKHVGQLDFIGGAGKAVFHRTGQALFQVVFDPNLGFYVDGPLIARHGLRDDFDPVAFCAALS